MNTMYSLSSEEFKNYAREYNLVPVYREVVADMETPVSAYLKLGMGRRSFLLESVEGGETLGRYSFIGVDSFLNLLAKNGRVEITGEINREYENCADPLTVVEELMSVYKAAPVPDLPPFFGGAVGYIGYEAVNYFERLPKTAPDDLALPDIMLQFTDTLVAFDHLRHKVKIIVNARVSSDVDAAYDEALSRIEEVIDQLRKPASQYQLPDTDPGDIDASAVAANVSKEQFMSSVDRAREYIFSGDILQVVLSQRFSMPLSASPFNIYRVLRTINPSPYLAYLNFGDMALVASSPEPLVRLTGNHAITRPIAGTRPRGANVEEDRLLEAELLADDKERAEHVMLVDLGRNDLGRVCLPGTVAIDKLMFVEKYSHVMHIVSQVSGDLRADMNSFDLLRAAFPAGTVSGAPKVRAMEIIDELEANARGPYAGVFGYFSFNGNLDTGITIRTVVVKDKTAYVQAGAGIVADSDPEREYQETVNKAMALLRAVGQSAPLKSEAR